MPSKSLKMERSRQVWQGGGARSNNHGCFYLGLAEGQAIWSYRDAAQPTVLSKALDESQNSSTAFHPS